MNEESIKTTAIIVLAIVIALFSIFFSQINERHKIEAFISNNTNEIISHQYVVYDTIKIKEVVYDTVKEYIKSTVYSNAIPYKLDTFEVHKGNTSLIIEFADGNFGMDSISEYQLLCNGSLYDKTDEEGAEWTNCNGEWILKFKGDR